jgi:hypothetical protein
VSAHKINFGTEKMSYTNAKHKQVFVCREKLENIQASIPFNSVCQNFSGLISGVMPEL